MAVIALNLTSGENGTAFSSATTASISPVSNSLVLAAVGSKIASSAPNVPTLSGCSMTWVQIATILVTANQQKRITVFRGLSSSPVAGALTVSWGGQNQERGSWVVDQFTNTDTSGTNGSGAIVQSATNSTTSASSLTVTLSAFDNLANATYGAFHSLNLTPTPGSGFSELAHITSSETTLFTEFKNINDTTVDYSTSVSQELQGIAIEIRAALSGGGLLFNLI